MGIKEKLGGVSTQLSKTLGSTQTATTESSNAYLVNVKGQDTETYVMEEDTDMQTLYYKDEHGKKECAIASKPTLVELQGTQHRIYFTRDGIQTTISLHKDTLLKSDKYKPATGEDQKEDDGMSGELTSIEGSKRVLHEQNKAQRMLKLMQPQEISRKKQLLYLGAGASLGMIITRYMMQNGGF